MRACFIVPFRDSREFAEKRFASIRHEQQAREQTLDRQDGSFDNRERSMFSNGTVAWRFDALATAPYAESGAVELLAAIADDMARGFLGFGYRPSKESSHGMGSRLIFERGDTH